jgi:hypothetical protein
MSLASFDVRSETKEPRIFFGDHFTPLLTEGDIAKAGVSNILGTRCGRDEKLKVGCLRPPSSTGRSYLRGDTLAVCKVEG